MASTDHTQHYGLNQWEPGDQFLRADFNADNAKLDQALHRLDQRLVPISYNVYNLALQNYYEGKETGFKKALLFDGFLDGAGVASVSGGMMVREGAARVYGKAEASWSQSTGSSIHSMHYGPMDTPNHIAQGGGRVTGLLVHRDDIEEGGGDTTFVVSVIRNNQALGATRHTVPAGTGPITLTLDQPVDVMTGDVYLLRVEQTAGPWVSLRATIVSSKFYLRCDVHVAYEPGAGGLTAKPADLGAAWERCLIWVRSTGGTVTPSLNGAAVTKLSQADGVNLQGEPCTETCWEGPAGGGTAQIGLEAVCGSGRDCMVYDYGAVFL